MIYTFTDPSPVVVSQGTKKSFWDKVYANTFRLRDDSLRTGNTTIAGNIGAGEDTIMSLVLPANSLNVNGKAVRITCFGDASPAGNNTVKLKLVGTAGGGTIVQMGPAVFYGHWRAEALIVRMGGALLRSFGTMIMNGAATAVICQGVDTIDSCASDITFSLTGETSSGTTDQVRHLATFMEVLG